jgi:hypothetical protein
MSTVSKSVSADSTSCCDGGAAKPDAGCCTSQKTKDDDDCCSLPLLKEVAIKTLVVVIVLAIVNLVPKNHAVMKESTVALQQVIKGHAVMTMAAAVSP